MGVGRGITQASLGVRESPAGGKWAVFWDTGDYQEQNTIIYNK